MGLLPKNFLSADKDDSTIPVKTADMQVNERRTSLSFRARDKPLATPSSGAARSQSPQIPSRGQGDASSIRPPSPLTSDNSKPSSKVAGATNTVNRGANPATNGPTAATRGASSSPYGPNTNSTIPFPTIPPPPSIPPDSRKIETEISSGLLGLSIQTSHVKKEGPAPKKKEENFDELSEEEKFARVKEKWEYLISSKAERTKSGSNMGCLRILLAGDSGIGKVTHNLCFFSSCLIFQDLPREISARFQGDCRV